MWWLLILLLWWRWLFWWGWLKFLLLNYWHFKAEKSVALFLDMLKRRRNGLCFPPTWISKEFQDEVAQVAYCHTRLKLSSRGSVPTFLHISGIDRWGRNTCLNLKGEQENVYASPVKTLAFKKFSYNKSRRWLINSVDDGQPWVLRRIHLIYYLKISQRRKGSA